MRRVEIHTAKHDDGYGCTEEVYINFLLWLKSEYQFIFRDCWMFEYSDESDLSKRMIFDTEIGTNLDYADKYYGIRINKKKPYTNCELEIIELINSGKVVPIEIDGFLCDWVPQYKKIHIEHSVIINGYDLNTKEFECIDPYYDKERIVISYSNLIEGIISYYTYDDKNKMLCDFRLDDELRLIYKNYVTRDSLSNLKKFRDDVVCKYDELCGMLSINYIDTDFYQSIDKYRRSRKKFYYFVNYLRNYNNCAFIEELLSESDDLRRTWNNFQKILLKMFISNSMLPLKNKVIEYIDSIVEKEERILGRIKYILDNKVFTGEEIRN